MEMYESELQQAVRRITARGRDQNDFSFKMEYLPPDPDGGGMFTVRYEIAIRHQKTSKSLTLVGGIGLDWVRAFDEALEKGRFD